MRDEPRKIVEVLLRLFKVLRANGNTTLESAADRAQIHRTHLGLLERGARQPTISVAIQIARGSGYELSELLAKAELVSSGKLLEAEALAGIAAREPAKANLRNASALADATGLEGETVLNAIKGTYKTLDTMDAELVKSGTTPIAHLIELANLSSMVGNLLGAGLAEHSDGAYVRNKPHSYPDLLPQRENAKNLEIKMALETNRPKGHLAKAGHYITFRYVLGTARGEYVRGKENRGDTVWIWEVKAGYLSEEDFDISNTEGDSGKTAVIKSSVFNRMAVVYFDAARCPHKVKADGIYPAHN